MSGVGVTGPARFTYGRRQARTAVECGRSAFVEQRMTHDAFLPPDLHALVSELTVIERDADALVSPLDDDQFNWCPSRGAWSIAQCVGHLNAMNAIYFGLVEQAVSDARRAGRSRQGPIACTWIARRFIASMEPPPRLRQRAPGRTRPPADRRHKVEVWPEFVRFHAHARRAIAAMVDVDLNRATFGNPFLGGFVRMRAGSALRIITAHERRHLWQARRVREAPGFPR